MSLLLPLGVIFPSLHEGPSGSWRRVFLDWYVNRTPSARGSDIWVPNPKELAGWIRRERETLSDADVAMATLHLKQYVKKLAA